MRKSIIPLALAGGLAASAALAQQPAPPLPGAPGASGPTAGAETAPPPPPPPGAIAGAEVAPPPPPPGGPRPGLPPPPPPGAHVRLDREPNGVVRVDVHCAQQETTKDCAAIASRLLAETSAAQSGK